MSGLSPSDSASSHASPAAVATGERALREGAALVGLESVRVLEARGADHVRFLQNMLTNDIASLEIGGGCHAFHLDVRGRILGSLDVLREAERMVLAMTAEDAARVVPGLERRIILEEVTLAEDPQVRVLTVQGPRSHGALQVVVPQVADLATPLAHTIVTIAGATVRVVQRDRCGYGGVDLQVPADAVARTIEHLAAAASVPQVPFAALDRVRIAAGIPWPGYELTPDHFPQEAGLEDGWISYRKGCYPGQEIMSRMHHQGHVNYRLVRLHFAAAELPAPGARLFDGDRRVGEITSRAPGPEAGGGIGLGYVHRSVEPGATLEVRETAAVDSGTAAAPRSHATVLPDSA